MRAINLKTNHLTAPVGIDAGPLFLSWQCAGGVRQTAYEIEVTANNKTVWQSGKVQSSAMHADTPAVADSRVRGCWRVRLWDENDVPGAWSEARFETGLAQCDWVGEWVDPETEPIDIPGDDAINAFARPNWERKQAEEEAAARVQPSRTSPIVRHRTCAKASRRPRARHGCISRPRDCTRHGWTESTLVIWFWPPAALPGTSILVRRPTM